MLNRRTAIPRISLYRPERGNDYEFTDRIVRESFTVGGTDIMLHKYLGPDGATEGEGTADQPVYDGTDPTQIQDLLFLENRDRKYDPSIYRLRGIYNVQDLDFNLSQFGLFLDNDTLFLTVHINSSVKDSGQKTHSRRCYRTASSERSTCSQRFFFCNKEILCNRRSDSICRRIFHDLVSASL